MNHIHLTDEFDSLVSIDPDTITAYYRQQRYDIKTDKSHMLDTSTVNFGNNHKTVKETPEQIAALIKACKEAQP